MSFSLVPLRDVFDSELLLDVPVCLPIAEPATFANPIAPGADPWIVQHDGFYYWCASESDLGVAVYRSTTLTNRGEKQIVWRAPQDGPHSREVWAPELHRVDDRWYIYVAASNGRNETHRMIVLEATSDDPAGEFRFKAELYTGDDEAAGEPNRWAIDGTLLEHDGQRYMLWSGWTDDRDEQHLYIARMLNPWTLDGRRLRLCANDDFLWERVDETSATRGLNEGPQILQREGRVFVVYSASASWETTYKLGMLELAPGGDPLNPDSWRKHREPVLRATDKTWGVGHNCFVRSPDGSEDWIVFHAKLETTPNWNRAIHAQPFHWDHEGRPVFGAPVDPGVALARPSGEFADSVEVERESGEVALGRAALAATVGQSPMVEQVRVVEVTAAQR
jgi:GH43 family beta-xylosidase